MCVLWIFIKDSYKGPVSAYKSNCCFLFQTNDVHYQQFDEILGLEPETPAVESKKEIENSDHTPVGHPEAHKAKFG